MAWPTASLWVQKAIRLCYNKDEMQLATSSDASPFGEAYQSYWEKRYDYFSRFDDGIHTDGEGLYSVTPEAIALNQARLLQSTSVLDGFGGIGGCAIALARSGKQVICCELHPKRLQMARHNAAIYGVEELIDFRLGDFYAVAQATDTEAVNLDPPWGGFAYKSKKHFTLADFSPDGTELLSFCLRRYREVMFKTPATFDIAQLDQFGVPYHTSDEYDGERLIFRTVLFRAA